MKNKIQIGILLSILCFFAFSCKSTKETTRIQLQSAEIEDRINYILDHSIEYNTLSMSAGVSLKMEGRKNAHYSCNGQVRIIKDECVQLSFTMPLIGSEIFKLTITPDSITIIDRYNKEYINESIRNIKDVYPFDFNYYDMESLFTNRIFVAGEKTFDPSFHRYFTLLEDEYDAFLNYRDRQNISYTFTSDHSNKITNTAIHYERGSAFISWDYADFKKPNNTNAVFPMKEDIVISLAENTIQLTLNFKNIDLNKNLTIDYNIPKKYKEIQLDQLINSSYH
ncbi:DUF4292 domain-containing protein [Bacteroidales bacterium OttesenSCG-928-M11]|nr:DUF4292 domain-containing protein [Bacteroidales bacterium OttesenSCG-928-M11]